LIEGERLSGFVSNELRVILIGRDVELRVISLIVRCRSVADEVIFLDLGSNDETVELASEVDCPVLNYDDKLETAKIIKFLHNSKLEEIATTLLIHVTPSWKLRDLPLTVNRARDNWDLHIAVKGTSKENINTEEIVLSSVEFNHLVFTPKGMEVLSNLSPLATVMDLPEHLKVRVVSSNSSVGLPQRESLATASRFAQLFYWMIESKHPLFLFGIPGIVLFVLGYKLSGNVVDTFDELNSTSIGVTLSVIAMTMIGLFAMMVALILYIMGKQAEQIQSQYDWKNKD
jgi:hypothetical protein